MNLTVRLSPFDFAAEPFDAAIHYGSPIWANAIAYHLIDEQVVPVCSPHYRELNGLRRPSDLTRAILLHQTTRPTAWAEYFSSARIPAFSAFKGHRFELFATICRAAVAGLGVALLPTFFCGRRTGGWEA